MKISITFFMLILINLSCNNYKETPEKCPYKPINNFEKKQNTLKTDRDFGAEFALGFEALVNVMTTIKVEPKIQYSVNKTSHALDSSTLTYNLEFVKKWNALVSDICGKISILEYHNLSDDKREKIERNMIDKITNFYEIVTDTDSTKQSKTVVEDNQLVKKQKQPITVAPITKDITFSIQLDSRKTKGYKEILKEGKKVNLSLDSTPLNPRIILSNEKSSYTLKIITIENDTCEITVDQETIRSQKVLNRFVPNCFYQ